MIDDEENDEDKLLSAINGPSSTADVGFFFSFLESDSTSPRATTAAMIAAATKNIVIIDIKGIAFKYLLRGLYTHPLMTTTMAVLSAMKVFVRFVRF